jgi:hypothetical protein
VAAAPHVVDQYLAEVHDGIVRHQPWRPIRILPRRCTAGCGRWPCRPFLDAVAHLAKCANRQATSRTEAG